MPLRDAHVRKLDHGTLSKVETFERMNYEMVHYSGGGLGTNAIRGGYSNKEALSNEVCPTNMGFKFGALDWFVQVWKLPMRERQQFVAALVSLLECDAQKSEQIRLYENVMAELALLGKEVADVNAAVFESLEDNNRIDPGQETTRIAKELDDVIERAQCSKAALLRGEG